jgi:hypothetical protein
MRFYQNKDNRVHLGDKYTGSYLQYCNWLEFGPDCELFPVVYSQDAGEEVGHQEHAHHPYSGHHL